MYALVDCNNFYASCERLFNPKLLFVPVVVLSNNDGCVIARSDESKAIGIEMGAPAFKMKSFLKAHSVEVYSSNYTLYGDISRRVYETLSTFTPCIEKYSIDESFLDLGGFIYKDLSEYSRNIKYTVYKWVGVPVSVGVANTKTLAKVANRIAKKNKDYNGVCVLQHKNEIEDALKSLDVSDIWGIGRQYSRFLKSYRINTAYDLTQAPDTWIKKNLSIVGFRIVEELRGKPSIELEEVAPVKKGICTAQSFGNSQSELSVIKEALATYVARACEKLRKQKSCANIISVFLETNPFKPDEPQYFPNKTVTLPVASCSTAEIVKYAITALEKIYRKGYKYKKVGIFLTGIVPDNQIQGDIFNQPIVGNAKLMETLDSLNSKFGRDKIRLAAQGYERKFKMRQEKLSPCFTTRLSDVLVIN